jgi:hypothetical protein
MSERQFPRYRDRNEEDGLDGLVDRRLGKPSPQRVPLRAQRLMLKLYEDCYRGWTVKHFHEHLARDHDFRWATLGLRPNCTRQGWWRGRRVKAHVKVRRYPDGTLVVLHGPGLLAHYTEVRRLKAEVGLKVAA